jgi:RHS repeat-associated protein
VCASGLGGSPTETINTFTGNLTIQDTPVWYQSVGGAIPFVVTFNSQSGQTGPLGNRWTHSYNLRVTDDGTNGALVVEGNGWERYYSGTGYANPPGVFAGLGKRYQGGTWLGWKVTRPNHQELYFDLSGNLTEIHDKDGLVWTLSYSNGLLSTITDPKNRQTTLQYTNNLLTRVTVPGGLYATFQYDNNTPKRLWKITDAAGQTYTFGYSGTRVTSITDPSGRQVWYQYYTFSGKYVVVATGITGNANYDVTYDYGVQGNGTLFTDVTALKEGADRVTRYIHEHTDDPGNWRFYGALLQVVRDCGDASHINATEAWDYNSDFRVCGHRDSYQPETGGKPHLDVYWHADAGASWKVTQYCDAENYDPGLGEFSPSYHYLYATGDLTQVTTPEGRQTDYDYTDPVTHQTTRRIYKVTVHDQDVSGNPVDRITQYDYWGAGDGYQLKSVTDARNNTTTYYYDSNGYLDYIDPPLGNNIDYTCNSVGDVTAITDGNGNTTSYQYDGIHRQTQITYPDVGNGQKTKTFAWTCCGLDQVTDENGIITKYEYDQYTHRLWKVHEDYATLNYVTEYGYDEVGNLKTVKNARLKTTTHTYDAADRLIRTDYPDSTYETWVYRDDNRLWKHTDARGRMTTYRYDADDRLAGSGSYKAIDYPNDTDVQITRDKDGLITTAVDASGTTTNVYYPSTWLKTTTVSAGTSKTITYQYNGVGLVSDMAVSGESSFTYGYNARNQLSSVTNPNSVQVSFSYDNGGRRTQVTRPGSYIQYLYNARDWITAVRNRTTGGTTRYDASYYYNDGALWDHTGNPVKRTENLAGSTYNTTLRYDHLYRQTEETKRDSGNNVVYGLGYGYDAVGNRTTRTLGGVTITYVYDDNDKMTSALGGGQSATFGYDNNGNMTSVSGTLYGSKTLVYNDDNRLTSLTSGGVTDLYYYKYTGDRYRARLAGTYYRYLYNGERVLEELSDGGTMQARYTTEDGSYYGQWLHLYRGGPTPLSRFPMYDNIGSARGLLDASGTATDWYELDTFGRQVSSSGATPNPYRFGAAWGYITDPSGFLQLGQRFYWPEVGRFAERDPLERDDRQFSYAYANDRPVVGMDADGRTPPWLDCHEKHAYANKALAECTQAASYEYLSCLCAAGFIGAGATAVGAAGWSAAKGGVVKGVAMLAGEGAGAAAGPIGMVAAAIGYGLSWWHARSCQKGYEIAYDSCLEAYRWVMDHPCKN